MNPLKRKLFAQLECPVCFETMTPPIHQCVIGHNICQFCRIKVDGKCPTCRQSIKESRNFALEEVTENLRKPCKNRELGCRAKLLVKELKAHEFTCAFEKHRCPFAEEKNCDFKGLWNKMLEHANEIHSEKILCGARRCIVKFHAFESDANLIVRNNHIFKITEKLDKPNNSLKIVVVYIGPIEYASKFRYEIEVIDKSSNGNSTGAVSNVKPFSATSNRAFEDCMCFSYSFVKMFCTDDDDLHFDVKIRTNLSYYFKWSNIVNSFYNSTLWRKFNVNGQ